MHCDILTIFPSLFAPVLNQSILQKAQQKGLFAYRVHNLRDFAAGRHKQVDDLAYGGGPGMVLKPEPIFAAVEAITACWTGGRVEGGCRFGEAKSSAGPGERGTFRQWPPNRQDRAKERIILMSPQGKLLSQDLAKELALSERLLIICGRYEGVDERVARYLPLEEVSIGDYVLSGGELPALVLLEAVVRLIPGVLGDEQSASQDSFYHGLLDHPHYTRPADFRGMKVPAVLLSGNHEQIRRFRRSEALKRTWLRRPELLEKAALSPEDEILLQQIKGEGEKWNC